MNHFKNRMKTIIKFVSLLLLANLLVTSTFAAEEKKNDDAAKATTTAEESTASTTNDPYEGFNRAMFSFNEFIDKYLLKPIARGYNTIMPKPLNQGVHNFFLNIGNTTNIANDLLQFNFYQATNDTWRLFVNTTIGIGGLFDIAGRMGLKPYNNDFGLTLATWGYASSNYLVLPFFGPSTPRDTIGIPVDYYFFSVYPYIKPDKERYGLYALGVIDRRAQLLQFEEVVEEAALDKYVFVRNAYLQRRTHQIKENAHRGVLDQLNGYSDDNDDTGASDATTNTKADAKKVA